MILSRRALLATPLLLGTLSVPARAADIAMLRPGLRSALGLTPLLPDRASFRAAGLAPEITLPASRARAVAVLPIAGREIVLLGFGADPSASAPLELGAFVGWDGSRLRVLALEVLSWRPANGGVLSTRVKASGDRTRLMLLRGATLPVGRTRWRREYWIDMLAWREGEALADAPVRVPPPETWQALLAHTRIRVAARLAAPCSAVAEDLTGLFAPDSLPPR